MRDVDRRIECQSLTQQIWDAIEEKNALIMQRTDAENQLLTLNGKLWRLEFNLQEKEAALIVAHGASKLGLPGKVVGTVSVAYLEWEIRGLKDKIADVKREIAPFQKIIDDSKNEEENQESLKKQLLAEKRALGCDRLNL